jgi:hypothetical protein
VRTRAELRLVYDPIPLRKADSTGDTRITRGGITGSIGQQGARNKGGWSQPNGLTFFHLLMLYTMRVTLQSRLSWTQISQQYINFVVQVLTQRATADCLHND